MAARDALPVKVEMAGDGQKPVPPEKIPPKQLSLLSPPESAAFARISEWCGGSPAPFLQLTRNKLRELVGLLENQPCFFRANNPKQPITWNGNSLDRVSPHIEEPTPKPARPMPSPAPAHPPESSPPKPPPATSSTPMGVEGSIHFLAITLPSREHPLYREALDLVKGSDFRLEPSNRRWWLRDKHKTLVFLSEHLEDLRTRFEAIFTPNFERNLAVVNEANVTCQASDEAGDYEIELSIHADGFDSRQVQAALQTGRPYLERDGRVTLLPKKKIDHLEEVRRMLSGTPKSLPQPRSAHRLSGADLALAGDLLDSLLPGFMPPTAWRDRAEALGNISKLAPPPVSPGLDERLRLYQRIGTAWMYHIFNHGLAGILADEMGLGKTVQALAFIDAARQGGVGGKEQNHTHPALVVCPASLVENWRREANRFLPEIGVFLHYRDQRILDAKRFAEHDLVITSYSTLIRDQELFQQPEWNCIIADEAQHIKNRRTLNAKALCSLRSRGRFVLTGTPIENSLSDLVSLFSFLMPGHIANPPAETRGEERAWHDERIRKKAAPYILRRTKAWVAPELPEKIEQALFCDMEPGQRALYDSFISETRGEFDALEKRGESEGAIKAAMFVRLLRLRQICCDPRLVDPNQSGEESAKLNAFRELLSEAIDDGHRMLVFSQFVSVLNLLKEELDAQGMPFAYLDGQTRNRLAVCDTFNSSPEIPVFLISLKAGGVGLNLTGADTVLHYDPWWNPAAESQATGRAHRIGQKKVVTSIKLIAAGTVEEKVLALQQSKQALLEDLFDESRAATSAVSLSDIRDLLS